MTADVSIFESCAFREWFTARELAELRLPDLPITESSLIRLSKRHDWQSTSLARKRSGRGGGWEYHIDLLPEGARSELQKRFALERHQADNSLVQSKRAIAVQNQQAFNARQRVMMEARAALLVEIKRRSIISDLSRRKAILQFLEDLNLYRAGLPTSDEHSKDKTDYAALSEAAELAAERRNSLSLRSVYGWFSARDEGGVTALAPQIKKKTKSLAEVEWFGGFLKFYARPSKPSIAQALGDYIETLEDKSLAPSYKQVRTALSKLGNVDRVRGPEGALTADFRNTGQRFHENPDSDFSNSRTAE
ncbi:Mu DNA-binding domain-containing protein [Cohaesibacter sp. ES.047]|uniref:DNA-binding protein n=1 Tax=Cohaesibacter sp. ES.047 TaxID=1798205 RepID=UPI000BC0E4C9|nr:DNA-binding protein [Cohaesibacter sp. ES.047]SNY90082.1 Mu DNA-binding domain-containing protein [Cohaesibacter sp. ES.047]